MRAHRKIPIFAPNQHNFVSCSSATAPIPQGASQICKFALIPQPLLPKWAKGSEIQSPSPPLGEGFRVRVTKVECTRSHIMIPHH